MPFLIVRNDITKMQCDAIVAPTERHFSGGGGADAAIHRAAGPRLAEACQALPECGPGEARLTGGFDLPCRYVIHTVGPRWFDGKRREEDTLRACYQNALALAADRECETVAFPLLAAGTYRFPKETALKIAVSEIGGFLEHSDMTVFLTVYDRESVQLSKQLTGSIEEYIDEHYVREHSSPQSEMLYSAPPMAQAAPMPRAEEETLFRRRPRKEKLSAAKPLADAAPAVPYAVSGAGLEDALKNLDESFSQMLLRKIDERGMTDAQCYKKANIDRKLFSKIRSDAHYKPSKATAAAFAIALELPLPEARELLQKAGFALSHSSVFDVIVEYFIVTGNYDILEINAALFRYDQVLLGSQG